MNDNELKTKDYTRRAVDAYNAKIDRIMVNLPKGSKEKIKELTGKSCNAYISDLVLKDLEKITRHKEIEKMTTEEINNIFN